MELSYISDALLRQRIEDSIEFIYALYEKSKQIDTSDLYKTETYRVIVVYTVSIIEAVLFDLYGKRKKKISKVEYKELGYIKDTYKNIRVAGKVLVAVEKIIEKTESEISLRELVLFLEKDGALKNETSAKLLSILPLRNSMRLSF
jgi:hypothetical protein